MSTNPVFSQISESPLDTEKKMREPSTGQLKGNDVRSLKDYQDKERILRKIAQLAKVKLEKVSKSSQEEYFKQVEAFANLIADNSQVKEIRTLDLQGRELKFIPPEIFSFVPNLEILILRNNQLSELKIPNLKNLKWLDLRENNISIFPEEIHGLKRLEELHMEKNFLAELPLKLSEHKNLKWLWLDRNQLTDVPEEFDKQKQQLTVFSLKKNCIPEDKAKRIEKVFGEKVVGLKFQKKSHQI